jgi:hypothetical protein
VVTAVLFPLVFQAAPPPDIPHPLQNPHSGPPRVLHARAGTINWIDGIAYSDALPVQNANADPANLTELRAGQELSTRDSRAEVLLGLDIYFRLDHNSRMKLENETLDTPMVTLEQGVALVEVVQKPRSVHPQVRVGGTITILDTPGLYRFEAGPNRLLVFGGSAEVTSSQAGSSTHHSVHLSRGQQFSLTPASSKPTSFDRAPWRTEAFQVWCADRSFDIFQYVNRGRDKFSVQKAWAYTNDRTHPRMRNKDFDVEREVPPPINLMLEALKAAREAEKEASKARK